MSVCVEMVEQEREEVQDEKQTRSTGEQKDLFERYSNG